MSAVFGWLALGAVIGLVIGIAGTWLVMRQRQPMPVPIPEPLAAEVEPDVDLYADMGRTAEAMLADLERKFGAMRKAEAEKSAKPKRKRPPKA